MNDTELNPSEESLSEEMDGLSNEAGHDDDTNAVQVYEIGYHLIPTLSEDSLHSEVAPLKEALEKAGASVVGERMPVKIDLAYAIEKKLSGTKHRFSQGYFGWMAFEVSPSKLPSIDQAFKEHPHVLRHIAVATNRDLVAGVLANPALDVPPVSGGSLTEEIATGDDEKVIESVGADAEEPEKT